ncbi:MAG: hypothetical protein INQ03_08350 [Candidatus Heimdallarchaeota archaeon]|nr:hypothetical protein [Candidatus Heimdallarchaeota archaeon]
MKDDKLLVLYDQFKFIMQNISKGDILELKSIEGKVINRVLITEDKEYDFKKIDQIYRMLQIIVKERMLDSFYNNLSLEFEKYYLDELRLYNVLKTIKHEKLSNIYNELKDILKNRERKNFQKKLTHVYGEYMYNMILFEDEEYSLSQIQHLLARIEKVIHLHQKAVQLPNEHKEFYKLMRQEKANMKMNIFEEFGRIPEIRKREDYLNKYDDRLK